MTEAEWLASEDPSAMLRHLNVIYELGPVSEPGVYPKQLVSDRKLRLFAVAVERSWYGSGATKRSLACFKVAESWANGVIGGESKGVREFADDGYWMLPDAAEAARWQMRFHNVSADLPTWAALLRDIVGNPFCPATLPYVGEKGNVNYHPSFPIQLHHDAKCTWLTPQVMTLATAAYEERLDDGTLDGFRLMLVADALEDAECVGEFIWLCENRGTHSHNGKPGQVIHGVLHDFDPRKAHHHHDEKCNRASIPHPLLEHLRSPGPHYCGMWSLDLILGKS